MAVESAYKAAVWKRDLVSMLPRCTPNSSRLDSSKLLNTFPLETPVCFLFSACSHGVCLTRLLGTPKVRITKERGGPGGRWVLKGGEENVKGAFANPCCSAQSLQLDDHTSYSCFS